MSASASSSLCYARCAGIIREHHRPQYVRKQILYASLTAQAQEILKRRPIEQYRDDVLRLKKVEMLKFLEVNRCAHKKTDNKQTLLGVIIDLISKSEANEATSNAIKIPGVSEEVLLSLPAASVEILHKMSTKSNEEIQKFLLDFGEVVMVSSNKATLMANLAQLLSDQSKLQKESFARKNKDNRMIPECAICMEESISAGFNPCGHAMTCMGCAEKLQRCPTCRKEIDSILHLYFS